jgi:predicted DNA-binding transcriptional regulator AlpA
MDRLLKLAEVEARTGFKKSWIYKKVRAGQFPAPARVGSSSRWSEVAVSKWITQQTEQTT